MEKRKALAGAGAITMTAIAGALAIGAAFGMLGADQASNVGKLSPVRPVETTTAPEPTPIVETIVVDVQDPPTRSVPTTTAAPPADTTTLAPAAGDDDPSATPDLEPFESEEEDEHGDEDEPTKTDDHANEDEHEDEDD